MSAIHFVGGEKGGVGKSVVARLLSQYFIDKQGTDQPELNTQFTYYGLDADQSHPTLSRYYQGLTRPVNVDHFESIDQIMEIALSDSAQIVVDLPAQSQRFLDRWIEDNDVLELCNESNVSVVYWYIVDDGCDSILLINNFLKKYENLETCVVIKNLGRGEDFTELENLPILQASSPNNTKVVQYYLPALHSHTLRKIDQLNFSFWAAINHKEGSETHLSIMERQRAKVWLKKSYAVFDEVIAPLLMNSPSAEEL